MERLLLVDGSNLLFQMFYGMPARITNAQGKPIQGTLGFVGALLKIIRMVHPTHAAVLFDGECANARTELDADYKANRPDYSALDEDDTPFSQLPDIFHALEYLNLPYAETTVCETDDWMAGYAKRYGAETEIVIASFDSDFFQLISDKVRILRYRGEKTVICGEQYLCEKLGVAPAQYAAFKAMTGDSADNIRGIPKIGPKTAAALMRQFGDFETLVAHCAEIEKPSIRASLTENLDRLQTNHALIRLEGAQELPFTLDALAWADAGLTTTQVLRAIGVR